jgi:hypothetical protein
VTTQAHLAVALLCGHLLADFVSQTKRGAAMKTNPAVLTLHALVAAALPYALVGAWTLWQIPAVTFLTHWLIDFIKVKSKRRGLMPFAIDQIAHLAVIAYLVQSTDVAPFVLQWVTRFGDGYTSVLIVIAGAILVTTVSGIVVGYVVRDLQRAAAITRDSGFPFGGESIGELERFLVFVLILIGQFEAIGFLIAAKSILRFGELKEERRDAEYVIIGTMWSLVCGLLVTLATRAALSWV